MSLVSSVLGTTGAVDFNGVIGGTGGVNVVGPGNVAMAAAMSYTGTTAVNAGVLALDFSQATSPAGNIVSGSSPLSLGGGVLALLGSGGATSSQAFNGTTVNPGGSLVALNVDRAGTVNLNLGGLARNAGGTVDFYTLGSGSIQTTSGGASTILSDANGTAYATVNGSDWAAKDASNTYIVGGSTLANFYTPSTANLLGGNADVAGKTTLNIGTTVTSLRFNNTSGTVNIAGHILTTGGILVTPGVTAAGSSITDGAGGGTLRQTLGGDLVVIQNSPQPFTISANIAGAGLTKSGSGLLVLGGSNTYTGTTCVNGGTLQGTLAALPTAIQLSNNANVAIDDQGGAATFSQSINGNGSFTKVGQGTLTLGTSSATATAAQHTSRPARSRYRAAAAPAGAAAVYSFDNVSGTTVNNDGSLGAAKNATLLNERHGHRHGTPRSRQCGFHQRHERRLRGGQPDERRRARPEWRQLDGLDLVQGTARRFRLACSLPVCQRRRLPDDHQ